MTPNMVAVQHDASSLGNSCQVASQEPLPLNLPGLTLESTGRYAPKLLTTTNAVFPSGGGAASYPDRASGLQTTGQAFRQRERPRSGDQGLRVPAMTREEVSDRLSLPAHG